MDALIAQVKELPPLKQKLVSAIIACLVADAAAQPLHWVYDDNTMQKVTESKQPEFLSPGANPFYRLPDGTMSGYGDSAMVLLHSLAKCKGLDLSDYAESYVKAFGAGSPCDIPKNVKPIQGPWQFAIMKRFSDLHAKGQTAKDIDDDPSNDPCCIIRTLPIMLQYYDTPEFETKLEDAFFMLQSSEMCLAAVKAYILLLDIYCNNENNSPQENIEKLKEKLQKCSDPEEKSFSNLVNQVLRNKSMSIKDLTAKFGKPWPLPGSFQSAIGGLLNDSGYVDTVRKVILAGGCNCSRLGIVAACLGIKYGIDGIPREWMDKTLRIEEALTVAIEVAKL